MLALNGIAAIYNFLNRYALNTPIPYLVANGVYYVRTFVFQDWIFVAHLLVIIFLDTVLGVWVALKKRNFSSVGFGRLFSKLFVYLVLLIATHNATHFFKSQGVDFLIKMFDSTVYAAIVVREYISLLEKIVILGVWTPPEWIFKKMKIWYEEGKTEKNESEKEKITP
jgi:hypothetical protein